MIVLIACAFLTLVAAKPNPEKGSYDVDGVGGMLYGIPEYEDPDMAILQMAGLGTMPVLTIMEVEKEGESPRPDGHMDSDQVESLKKRMDDVIEGLKMARLDLEQGKTTISEDMGKFIHCLKSIQRLLSDNKPSIEDSLFPSLPISITFHSGSDHKMEDEIPSSTNQTTSVSESPESFESKSRRIKTPLGDVLISTETKKLPSSAKSGKNTPIVLYSKRTVYKMKFDA